jgi:dihydrofolate reductase
MPKLRVHTFAISLDRYGAGPDQGATIRSARAERRCMSGSTPPGRSSMFGKEDGTTGIDDNFAARGMDNIGAWILGRNMFGPVRGPWPYESWRGWWGENPPYHVPVFVLTHHARPSLEMDAARSSISSPMARPHSSRQTRRPAAAMSVSAEGWPPSDNI